MSERHRSVIAAMAHNNLASLLTERGKALASIERYRRALARAGRPDEAHPHFVAGRRLARESASEARSEP